MSSTEYVLTKKSKNTWIFIETIQEPIVNALITFVSLFEFKDSSILRGFSNRYKLQVLRSFRLLGAACHIILNKRW